MHITFCADGNFLKPLELAVFSLLRTQKQSVSVHILMLDEFSTDNLSALAQKYDARITFYPFSTDLYAKGRFSKAMYGRLFIPSLLNSDIEKVIYLDCDVLVNRDLSDLWCTSLDGNMIAATPELSSPIKSYLLKSFTLHDYFNSGVLLLDLVRLREGKKFTQVLDYVHENENLLYPDQDALNVIFRNNWQKLPSEFNYMALNKTDDAAIIHYALAKPWNSDSNKNDCFYHQLVQGYPLPLPSFYQDQPIKCNLIKALKSSFIGNILRHLYWNYLKPIGKHQ
ncbi:lipopolysaccharide biosynthesis protein, glucosyltransferase [Aliivibrio wodanis]|uniref:Lipopolysaccharide biosynthesis protein, glucosyltransferase n=1 Tax=Aliivibrio wodanis TaxID=80852 RepID=A0A090IM18_9GAMM|nr:lipopolysaccharide biosynthesis protein, glucosyltransferase [Aliivibrio wodanis]